MQTHTEKLIEEIHKIYAISPVSASESIEELIRGELVGLPDKERLTVVDEIRKKMSAEVDKPQEAKDLNIDEHTLDRLITMILGRSASDLPPDILSGRLAESLNAIFDSLNQLTGLINTTLGSASEGDETIRHIIGTSLDGGNSNKPIEEHLGQIRKAFLVSQQAFKEASKNVLNNVLTVLDPKQMEPTQTGLKIGPLRKAESFEIFEEKYSKCKKWFDSERFMEDLLRQFEKNCQKMFNDNRG